MPAGNAYPSEHLVPSPFWGLVYAPIVEIRFPELVVSLLYFSPWIPLVLSRFKKIVNNPPNIDWGPTANRSGGVIKMWYTNMYSNITVYQKYIVMSIKVCCAMRSLYASSGPKAVKRPSTWPTVLSMIAGSYWRRRRRFTIFEPVEMKFALTLLSL